MLLVTFSITEATHAYLMMACGNVRRFYSLSPRVNSCSSFGKCHEGESETGRTCVVRSPG